jgi:hypothetical protein
MAATTTDQMNNMIITRPTQNAIDDIATGVDSNVRTFQEDRDKFVRALREAAAVAATGS